MNHQFFFCALSFSLLTSSCNFPLGAGFEINYDDNGFTGSFLWSIDKINIATRLFYENNYIVPDIKVTPIHRAHQAVADDATATIQAIAGNFILGTALLVYKKELKNRDESKKEDFYLQQCLKETEKGRHLFARIGIETHD